MYKYLLAILIVLHSSTAIAALPFAVEGQPLPTLAPMLDKVTPAIVNISTRTWVRVQENPLFNDPFFRHFFNLPRESKQRQNQSLGSGVVIDASKGYVITNHHVVDRADEISVTLRDGRSFTAEIVGSDPETDIALLKISAENLTPISNGDSDQLRVGDFVVAIGNPFGLGQTVTSGIVSALGRSGLGIEGYEDFIQTDASINPGNSGGALVNLRGELIGINTAILAPGGGNIGIGFAIPINMVNKVVQHLVEFGEMRRGILGVHLQDLTPELADAFASQDARGALVVDIIPNSPAHKAGIQKGDIITLINRKAIRNATEARNHIGLLRIGDRVRLSLLRQGRIIHLYAVVEDPNKVAAAVGIDGGRINRYLDGAILIEKTNGIEINQVKRDSNAWRVGLRPGDILLSLNDSQITNLQDLTNTTTRPLSIRIKRSNGDVISFVFR